MAWSRDGFHYLKVMGIPCIHLFSHQCPRMWSPRSPTTWETPTMDGSSSPRASARC